MQGGIKLGRIFGIEIALDLSWVLIFLLVTWNLAYGLFPQLHPEWSPLLNITVSVVGSLLFFSSVLAHEMAHSLVAKARGLGVDRITLFLFGGVANLKKEPDSAKTEFLVAIVGPITSIVLGAAFLLIAGFTVGIVGNLPTATQQFFAQANPVSTLFAWLGSINIILAIFNMIPGFPLDGGRVLRSFLWAISGNLERSTRISSNLGRLIAYSFIAVGAIMVVGIQVPLLGSGVIGGLWLGFIGWFLNNAARQGYQQVLLNEILSDIPVSRILRSKVPQIPANISISKFINTYAIGTDKQTFPVTQEGMLVGIVSIDDARKTSRKNWDLTKVEEIMIPASEVDTAQITEDASQALAKLASTEYDQVPVVNNKKLVGMLSFRDLLLWLQLNLGKKSKGYDLGEGVSLPLLSKEG